jgi:hypothetical protein
MWHQQSRPRQLAAGVAVAVLATAAARGSRPTTPGRAAKPRHHERLARSSASSQRHPKWMHWRSEWTGEARWSHLALPPVVRDLVRRPHRGDTSSSRTGGPTRPTLDVLPPCPGWCEANHDRQFGARPRAARVDAGMQRRKEGVGLDPPTGSSERARARYRSSSWSAIACDGGRGCPRTGDHVVAGRGCGKSHGRFGAGQEPAGSHDATG